MRLERQLRGCAAVVVGLLITAAFGLFILSAGLAYRFLCILAGYFVHVNFANPFEHLGKYWALVMYRVCIRVILDVRVEIEGTVKPLRQNEVVVCIANHPSTLAVPIFFWFITQRITSRFLVVAKRQHLSNLLAAPFVGWPLWIIRSGIFINRKDSQSAFASIGAALEKIGEHGALIVLFPDMQRPTPERIEADRAKFRTDIRGIELWLDHTLLPRSGGLRTILNQLYAMGRPPRVINLTAALGVADYGVQDAPSVSGAVFHLDAEEHRRIPRDERALQLWLTEEWKHKNATIGRWRGPS